MNVENIYIRRLIMNYLDKLSKIIKLNKKRRKINNIKSFWGLTAVGVVIGGTVMALFTKNYFREIQNIVINNAEDNGVEINEDAYEDKNIKDEIKETLEKVGEDSVGDVGVAIEDALEDVEEEKKS